MSSPAASQPQGPPPSNAVYQNGKERTSDIHSVDFALGENESVDAGRLDERLYDDTLQWWRADIRRFLVNCVENESDIIAAMQVGAWCPALLPVTEIDFRHKNSCSTHRIACARHGSTFFLFTPHLWEPTLFL
jgi:hypothetical protein